MKKCIGVAHQKCSNMVEQTLGKRENKTCPACKIKRNAIYRENYSMRMKELDNKYFASDPAPIGIRALDKLISRAINLC